MMIQMLAIRLDSLNKNGIEWVKELGCQNVRDLITMIQWNEDNVCMPLSILCGEIEYHVSLSVFFASLPRCFHSRRMNNLAILLIIVRCFSRKPAISRTSMATD